MQKTITPKKRLDYIFQMAAGCMASPQTIPIDKALVAVISITDSFIKESGFTVREEDSAGPIPNLES